MLFQMNWTLQWIGINRSKISLIIIGTAKVSLHILNGISACALSKPIRIWTKSCTHCTETILSDYVEVCAAWDSMNCWNFDRTFHTHVNVLQSELLFDGVLNSLAVEMFYRISRMCTVSLSYVCPNDIVDSVCKQIVCRIHRIDVIECRNERFFCGRLNYSTN